MYGLRRGDEVVAVTISPSDAVDGGAEETEAAEAAGAGLDASESSTSTSSSTSTLREMLLATDPNDPLDAVEDPWDPERGGPRRLYRAAQKMFGVDGMPAGIDLVVGLIETAVGHDLVDQEDGEDDGGESEESSSDASMGDVDPETDLPNGVGVGAGV